MRSRVLIGAALVLLLAATAPPAVAADEVGLSLDGETWHASLTEPLFDPDVAWVPGDSRTVSFLVRNQATTDASVRVTVRAPDRDDLLADDHLLLHARAGGAWVPLRNGQPSDRLTAALERADTVRVDLRATFDPRSTNASQTSVLAPEIEITLAEAVTGRPGDDAPGPEHSGWLPDTGSGTPARLAWLAGGLVAAGALLLRTATRRREGMDDA